MYKEKLTDMLEEYDKRRNQIEVLINRNKALKEKILQEVGTEDTQVGRFEIKTYSSSRFQTSKFKREQPVMYSIYCEYGDPVTYITTLWESEDDIE